MTDRRPVAIWTKEGAAEFHAAPENMQAAWNDYADHEAQVEVNCGDPDRQPGTMYQWTPPFTFTQFKHAYAKGLHHRLWRPLDYYNSATDYLTTRERRDHLTPHEIDYLTTPGVVPVPQSMTKVESALRKRSFKVKPLRDDTADKLTYETVVQQVKQEIAAIRRDIARQPTLKFSLFRTRPDLTVEDVLKRLDEYLDKLRT